jgi:S1-C subfamily serine protease
MRVSTRLIVSIVFVLGCITGLAAAVFLLVLPRDTNAQIVPTPAFSDEGLFNQIDALDRVMTQLYQRVSPSVMHIASRSNAVSFFYGVIPQEGTGSGFVYDEQGHIVTNYHVVANATAVDVLFAEGVTIPAQIVGVDPYLDLAVLSIDAPPNTLVPLELGDSSQLQVGQTVVAIGNPFGLDHTLTTGVISALERRIETETGSAIGQAIQTDAAINPGNSGGPLLDTRGRVVGINTAINSPSGGSVGIGFAVPVNSIKRVVPSLISEGRYIRPSLDAQFAELGTEIIPPEGGAQRGLLIVQLTPGGTSEQAGLRAAQISVSRGRYVTVNVLHHATTCSLHLMKTTVPVTKLCFRSAETAKPLSYPSRWEPSNSYSKVIQYAIRSAICSRSSSLTIRSDEVVVGS